MRCEKLLERFYPLLRKRHTSRLIFNIMKYSTYVDDIITCIIIHVTCLVLVNNLGHHVYSYTLVIYIYIYVLYYINKI